MAFPIYLFALSLRLHPAFRQQFQLLPRKRQLSGITGELSVFLTFTGGIWNLYCAATSIPLSKFHIDMRVLRENIFVAFIYIVSNKDLQACC